MLEYCNPYHSNILQITLTAPHLHRRPVLPRPQVGLGCGGPGYTMTTTREENAALVRRFLTDVADGGDTDAVEAFVTDDIADHHLVFGANQDRECEVTTLGWSVLAGADVAIDIEEVIAGDEKVAVRATVKGTHRESLLDLVPTGAPFEIAYVWFCRIDERQIDQICSLPDGLGLMQQLGAIPELSPNHSRTDQTKHPEP